MKSSAQTILASFAALALSACASTPSPAPTPVRIETEKLQCPNPPAKFMASYHCYQPKRPGKPKNSANKVEANANQLGKLYYVNESKADLQMVILGSEETPVEPIPIPSQSLIKIHFDSDLNYQTPIRAKIIRTAGEEDFGALRIGISSNSRAFCEATVPSGFRLVACDIESRPGTDSFDVLIQIYSRK